MIKKFGKKLVLLMVLVTSICSTTQAQNEMAYQAQYTNPAILRILKLDKTVRDKGAIVGTLTAQDLTRLPIGIVDPSGKVMICIDSAKFTANGATFSAYAAVQLPGMKDKLCFKATNIPFGPNGITNAAAPALTLVSTHVIQMGQKVDLVIPGTGGNNLQWDCNGFKEVNIEGKFFFKDGYFQVDKVERPNDTSVTATVKFEHITNINNMMASITITPFKIRGMEDFAFKVTDATVDMSDHSNPANFTFPTVYQDEFGANINLWRGFYLRNITVRLPFNKNNGNATIAATNMLIDENGVSGVFSAANVVDITQGSGNGWPLSIDTLSIQVLRNKLTGGAMAGGIKIPFLGNDSLGYKASVSQWNDETQYLFQLSLREDKVFNTPFKTHVKLSAGSYVQIEKYGDSLEPSAFLQGYMASRNEDFPDNDISNASSNVKSVKFSGLKFENVSLSTIAPYVHSGTFAIADTISSPTLAGFKISLNNIKFIVGGGQAKLDFRASLGFMDDSSHGFSASAGFTYAAEFKQETVPFKRLYWQSKGLEIRAIALQVNTGSFKLDGEINIYKDDPIYGNGFKGGITVKILPGKMDLNASGQVYFGNKNGLRYWQASAYVGSNNLSIPVVPGVLNLNGFLGGISWHMKKQDDGRLSLPVMLDSNKVPIPGSDASSWARQTYIPDVNSSLGIMVGVSFKTTAASALTGSVALEVGLNSNWGLNFVELKGMVSVFKDINKIDPKLIAEKNISSACAFRGEVSMLYDVPNKTFHANIAAYLNLSGQVVGAGPQNKLGELVMHFDPNNWYVYVGRPSSPLEVKIPTLAAASAGAYFMVGSQLEPFPAPPNEILQNISYVPMISAQQLKAGSGVAFGARFNTSFGFGMDSTSKSWVYGGFSVGAGADVMLSTSGNYTCGGEAAGFDGWWARGQAYAYLQGKVGIRVKKKKFDVANLSAGILLEAKIPKPSWFRGFGYFSYNVLGGLVKGKANFKVQFGAECQMATNPTEEERNFAIKIVSSHYPQSGQTDIPVYESQAIMTNVPINTPFEQMDDNGALVQFKCVANLTLLKNGVAIQGNTLYDTDKKKIFFKSKTYLESGAIYKLSGKFQFLKQLEGGAWTVVNGNDGTPFKEDVEFNFLTAPNSYRISSYDIDYAYPFSDMQNFYKNEYNQGGYININPTVDLSKALAPGDATNGGLTYDYKIRIKNVSAGSTDVYNMPFTLHNRTLKFDIPTGIQNEKVYKLSFIRTTSGGTNNTGNANQTDSSQYTNNFNNSDSSAQSYYSDTVVNNVATGAILPNELEMFSYHFRVSKYNTFSDKVASMNSTSENIQDYAVGNILLIGCKKNVGGELFDDFELKPLPSASVIIDGEPVVAVGNPMVGLSFPLIKVRADSTNPWLMQDILPRVYPNPTYGESTFYIDTVKRMASNLGNIPPGTNCNNLSGTYTDMVPLDKVTIEHIVTTIPHADPYQRLSQVATSNSKLIIKYNIPYYASLDYQQMYYSGVCNWLRAITPGDRSPAYTSIVESGGVFPQIRTGTYAIYLTYSLPGKIKTSTATLTIDY